MNEPRTDEGRLSAIIDQVATATDSPEARFKADLADLGGLLTDPRTPPAIVGHALRVVGRWLVQLDTEEGRAQARREMRAVLRAFDDARAGGCEHGHQENQGLDR